MRRLIAIAALALAAGACAPAPTLQQACRDMCAHLNECGRWDVHECGQAVCLEDFGVCNDDMLDYFVCVSGQDCGEPSEWCRSHVSSECGGWL